MVGRRCAAIDENCAAMNRVYMKEIEFDRVVNLHVRTFDGIALA